ncbi:hypothetical protein AYK26_06890 [Euryarchaeota archaeon SM23-78]|nr:MAG: hypothetical protein AYK26_06890 [Euryarchaeota archaeon SM23-78]MBW3000389.1 hypothetical protein [Candidatus Woesearchaeota archaeon]
MKKAQVSFEFIVLFAIVLFVFVVLVSFFPKWIDRTASTQSIAENLAKDIKVRAITASLSEANFESNITLPKRINNVNIEVEIHGAPDNLLNIKDKDTGKLLARAFLPKINEFIETNPNGDYLLVKREGEDLIIERLG